jgi:hypothetical protein
LITLKEHEAKIYKNGILAGSSVNVHPELYSHGTAQLTSHSRNKSTSWVGLIDEFRIASVFRQVGWALTNYNTQFLSDTFLSLGEEEQSEIKYYRVMAIQGIYSLGEFLQYLTVREITTKEADSWAVVGTSTVDDVDEVVGF